MNYQKSYFADFRPVLFLATVYKMFESGFENELELEMSSSSEFARFL